MDQRLLGARLDNGHVRETAVMAAQSILIAGGGIGGLAAALGLARNGLPSIVLEQASELGEIGAGIQIAPNAFHCFDRLGIGDQARAGAVYIDMLRLMDGVEGDEICHIPLGDAFRNRFGNPYAVVHRADLHTALADACHDSGLVEVRTSSEVVSYSQDRDGVIAHLHSNDDVRGAALIILLHSFCS